jgi:pyruvate dehydrogenase E1 component beta subunit
MLDEAIRTSLREAVNAAIAQELRRDERVVVLGFEAAARTGLGSEFGKRVLDTPISELAVMGMAVGAARCGLRPVVDLMGSSFFFLAMDQIANHAAVTHHLFGGRLPMSLVVRGVTGVGDVAGGAHHGRMAHSLLAAIPGLKVVMPADAASAAALMTAAIHDPNPVVFLEHVRLYRRADTLPMDDSAWRIGAAVRRRAGADLTIVGTGPTVVEALGAADDLAGDGLRVEVLDLCTVSPVDVDTVVASARRTGRLIVVDEAPALGSTASFVANAVHERLGHTLRAPTRVLTAPHANVPFAVADGSAMFLPTAARIADVARELVRWG